LDLLGALLGSPGVSWELLGSPGSSWPLLKAPGLSCELLDCLRSSWGGPSYSQVANAFVMAARPTRSYQESPGAPRTGQESLGEPPGDPNI